MVQVSNERSKHIFSFILSLDIIQYGQSYPTTLCSMVSMQEGMDFTRGACSIWNCMMMLSEVVMDDRGILEVIWSFGLLSSPNPSFSGISKVENML